ncbi:hypothetical protein BHE74_00048496 [Ensete ventricosum]|nr:hypothetical protein BHE74_00048496 [Ensete ventricosum]
MLLFGNCFSTPFSVTSLPTYLGITTRRRLQKVGPKQVSASHPMRKRREDSEQLGERVGKSAARRTPPPRPQTFILTCVTAVEIAWVFDRASKRRWANDQKRKQRTPNRGLKKILIPDFLGALFLRRSDRSIDRGGREGARTFGASCFPPFIAAAPRVRPAAAAPRQPTAGDRRRLLRLLAPAPS